jgi:hypothetical protein
MVLQQVNVISLKPLQGSLNLATCLFFSAAVNLGHEEDFCR